VSRDQAYVVEVQRFRQWWIVLLVAGPALIGWLAFWQQIVLGEPYGSDPAPDGVVIALWLAVGVVLPAALAVLRLETLVEPGEVSVAFRPFPPRVISTTAIVDVHAASIRPIADWGGYGYRRNRRKGTAFLVRGTDAVQLTLGPDDVVVIGTQEPERLATAIAEARRIAPDDDRGGRPQRPG